MKGQKFIPLLVIAAGLLAYHNSFTGPFIFDDTGSIQQNPTIRHLWPIWQSLSPPRWGGLTVEGRPLINLSLAVNYAIGGTEVWGYHALNLAIHILAGLTLLGIVRRTLLQPRLRERFGAVANELALAVAVLWTVHPLQTESVTYIIQRAESIMGLFYLLTLYCFIRGAESPRPRVWYGLCLSACALGMASKEVMASAPLLVMLYDRAFVSGSSREAWRRRGPLYAGLASTWILFGYLVFFHGSFGTAVINAKSGGVTWWAYLLTEPGVILHYLRLSAWPHPLCFDYFGWPTAGTGLSILLPGLVIAILLGATAWTCKTNSVWGLLGAWFFLILAPSSSFIPTDSPAFEHRMYLALAAVVVLVVMGIHALAGRRTVIVMAVLAVGLGLVTVQRNQDYRSEIAIWADTVAKRPENSRGRCNLGVALVRAGRVEEAIGHLEQALRINPDGAEVHCDLGFALAQAGRIPEAITQYEQALRIKPDYAKAHSDLGVALAQVGRIPEAIEHLERALRIKPDYAEAHCNLGVALAQAGRIPEAIEHLERALRIEPDNAEAHNNLGNVLRQSGKIEEAIAHYEQALRIEPDYAEAHHNLGVASAQAGRMPEAIEHLERALRIKPGNAETHYNLGLALSRIGKIQDAIGHYEQALRLNPDYAEAHYNLGAALVRLGRLPEAVGHWEQALRIEPDYAEAENNLAWLLATLAPADGGNPVRAVTLAERDCELTKNRVAEYLDTLAAAYAAAGRFNDAITTAQKAIELARSTGQTQLVSQIDGRLTFYRAGHGYYDPTNVTSPHDQ